MSIPTSAVSTSSDPHFSLMRRALPATAAIWGATLLTAPLAYWRHALPGALVVAAAGLAITLSVWLAAWLERSLATDGHSLAGLLAPSGVRMTLPLAFALLIVTWGRAEVAPQAVLYIVPLYLAMLVVETANTVQCHVGSSWPTAESSRSANSTSFKQG